MRCTFILYKAHDAYAVYILHIMSSRSFIIAAERFLYFRWIYYSITYLFLDSLYAKSTEHASSDASLIWENSLTFVLFHHTFRGGLFRWKSWRHDDGRFDLLLLSLLAYIRALLAAHAVYITWASFISAKICVFNITERHAFILFNLGRKRSTPHHL